MATSSLIFDILVNDKGSQAINNFASKVGGTFEKLGAKIGGEFGDLVSGVGEGLDSIGKSAPKLGQQLLAIGGAAFTVGTALQAMGSKDQQAQKQLQAAITATGASWSDYKDQVDEAIKSSENYAHTADETQNALATLTAATGDPAKALRNLQAAEDLAAAKHIELNDAAQLIARTLEGSTKLLKQYGIDLSSIGDGADKGQKGVDALEQKLSGQAAASVDTFAGKIEVVKAKVTDFASALAGPVGAGLQGFGAATALIGGILESGFIAKLKSSLSAADGFKAKVKGIASVVGPGALGLGGVLAAATIGFELFASAQEDGARRADEYASAIKADSGALGENTAAAIANELVTSGLAKQARTIGVDIGTYTQAILGNAAAQGIVGSAIDENIHRAGPYAAAAQDLRVGLDGNNQALTDQKQKYDDVSAATQAAQISLGGTATANGVAGAAAAKTTTALQLEKEAYDRLTNALTSFNNLSISAQKADIATRDALAKVSDALKDSKGKLDLHTKAGRDARSAVLDFASAVDTQAQAMAAEGKPHAAIVKLYNQQHDALQRTLIKMGLSKAEAKRYADSLLKIPKKLQTQLQLEIAAHLASVTYGKSVARGQGYASGRKPPPTATGGIFMSPQTRLIAEAGPEAVVPLSKVGALGTTNNYITINTKANPDDVVRAIQLFERRSGARWRR